jgi:phenylacetate-CoA ligase
MVIANLSQPQTKIGATNILDARIRLRHLALAEAQTHGRPVTDFIWSPDLECASRAATQERQSQRVALIYEVLWDHSEFYRRKFETAGLDRNAVQSLDDIHKIPLTYPHEWLADQEDNPPWGTFSPLTQDDWLERGWMLFTTSGTKAKAPRVFRHTAVDRDLWAWHGARALYAMGVRRGDIAINCFGYGTSVAFWGLHYALTLMGVPVIPGGGVNSARRALFIDRYRPTVLLGTPSYVLTLGRELAELGIDPRASSVRLLVCAGEPGACVPSTKARIEETWNAVMHDDFGCTEVAMSPLGYTCSEEAAQKERRPNVHLMEDQYLVEVLDPETAKPVAEGERGMLVVSNLYSEAQPILRYVMGDWVRITNEACACGRTQARAIGGLQGRSDELLKVRGLKFFPAAIEDAVRSLPDVGDEFIVELTTTGELDCMKVTIEPAVELGDESKRDALKLSSEYALKGLLGVTTEVEVVPRGSLPRTTAKAKRLFDRR